MLRRSGLLKCELSRHDDDRGDDIGAKRIGSNNFWPRVPESGDSLHVTLGRVVTPGSERSQETMGPEVGPVNRNATTSSSATAL